MPDPRPRLEMAVGQAFERVLRILFRGSQGCRSADCSLLRSGHTPPADRPKPALRQSSDSPGEVPLAPLDDRGPRLFDIPTKCGVTAWKCAILVVLVLLAASPVGPLTQNPPSPATVAARLQQRFDRVQDYDCLLHTETRAGTRVEVAAFHLWYRKPGLLRLRVLRGRHHGSELLLGADGVLRGRRGGLLRPFSRRLDRSDASLRSLRGQPAWELDFGSFLRAMRERMALPGSTATVQMPTAAEPHLLLEVRYRPAGATGFLRDVWSIDPSQWLLAGGDVFDGDTRVDHIRFSDVQLNTGLKESWFRF
jgi:outer membrane lipoprotein-sorting protein